MTISQKCIADRCTENALAKRCCQKHYRKLLTTGNPNSVFKQRSHRRCSVAECDTRKLGKRCTHTWFCGNHYAMMKTYGTPYYYNRSDKHAVVSRGDISYLVVKDMHGKVKGLIKVDSIFVDRLLEHKWTISMSRHARNTKLGIGIHHFVFGKNVMLDHINRDPLDNRRCNLRETDKRYNAANMWRSSQNTSGYKGVTWNKRNKNWVVGIKLNGKGMFLGAYDDKLEAARVYDTKAKELFGQYALTNEAYHGNN